MPKLAQAVKHGERPNKKLKTDFSGKAKSKGNATDSPTALRQDAPVEQLSAKKIGKQKAADVAARTQAALPSTFKIIAGSYEKLLYGLSGSVSPAASSSEYTLDLKPIFIFPAHVSCIKAVSASPGPGGGKWLATGSADEIIKVWDLRRRKEVGGLMHHEGSITHLTFPSRSHLLSASEDGTLALFRARDWSVLRALRGHKGRINSVAVHPSGKVALSVGQDRTLRMWDLMRGRGSASTKLGKEGELVRWSTKGTLFAVQTQKTIDLYSIEMVLLHTIQHPSRLHDIKFCARDDGDGDILLAAGEDKKLSVYDLSAMDDAQKGPRIVAQLVGHSNRVKAVDTLRIALPSSSPRLSTTIITTVSSDGRIHLYDLASIPSTVTAGTVKEVMQLEPTTVYDTKGTRLTCVTLAEGDVLSDRSAEAGAKRRREEESDEENEDDGEEWPEEAEDEEESEEEEEEEEDEQGLKEVSLRELSPSYPGQFRL